MQSHWDQADVSRMFGSGTGVVIVAIREIEYLGKLYTMPYHPGVLLLRNAITGIHRGRIQHPWSHKVPDWNAGRASEKQVNGDHTTMA